jgi:hypothetical protein
MKQDTYAICEQSKKLKPAAKYLNKEDAASQNNLGICYLLGI